MMRLIPLAVYLLLGATSLYAAAPVVKDVNELAAHPQKLSLNKDVLAVARLDANTAIPQWALAAKGFSSITRTLEELSIVCVESQIPKGTKTEPGFQAFKIEGPLDFSLTGILASIAGPLAKARVSIFAISTFDTDYVLVKKEKVAEAIKVLQAVGHTVTVRD